MTRKYEWMPRSEPEPEPEEPHLQSEPETPHIEEYDTQHMAQHIETLNQMLFSQQRVRPSTQQMATLLPFQPVGAEDVRAFLDARMAMATESQIASVPTALSTGLPGNPEGLFPVPVIIIGLIIVVSIITLYIMGYI